MSAMMDLIGTMMSYFKIGGNSGVRLKNNSANLDVRSADDSAFANVSAATLKANDPDIILDADGNALTVSRNSSQAGALQMILPPAKGADGQVLAQKAGTASDVVEYEFVTVVSAQATNRDTTALAFGTASPLSMFNIPANAVLEKITVIVDTAFNGTAPTMTVGITGTTSKYLGSSQVDLKTVGIYIVHNSSVPVGTVEALITTYSADGSSAGAARIIVDYSVPV